MTEPVTDAIHLLAFGHRCSFHKKLLGIPGTPHRTRSPGSGRPRTSSTPVSWRARELGLPGDGAGMLVDEEYGSAVARAARELGVILAMQVQKSGRQEFDLEYGEAFGDHVTASTGVRGR